ncbi:hypothetical protein [Salinisphaera sp. Q1T1-3]|uniref:FFLEELY motif protein n=1 Tax=Salinisphaera sp. Q1T1-3 TaxID=2321229 RepID=UPI000E74E78E|nr:hypothetical protein [Salinisphaera sp. Q1T1-3]RJS91823.1 hypothetical protein D3260_13720 [Salinisphaera sp. Q1T1-3]
MTDSARHLGAALADLRDIRDRIAAREDPAFHACFAALRRWQADQVAQFHAERAAAYDGEPLLVFLTQRFYADADWSELTGRPEKVAGAIQHIVDRDRPLVIAIELQAAAERLDADMVDALLAGDGGRLTPRTYVRAMRRVGRHEDRAQQIRWLEELIELVADYADNRAAHWGFKLARTPARTFGLARTYELLAEGFEAMRTATDLKTGVHDVIAAQRARLERLLGTPLTHD